MKPVEAHLGRRRKALDQLRESFNKQRDRWDAELKAVNDKHMPKLKEMKALIESEEAALKELEDRLKA
jgi:hypothetical protein